MDQSLRTKFEEHGYLVLPDYIKIEDCQKLILEQQAILETSDMANAAKVVFDTASQQHAKQQYFFESARNISLFFEPDAFDSSGHLQIPLSKAINKIGHGLHDFNQVFKTFSYQTKIKQLIQILGIKTPKIVQSMYLLKQPKIGNQVDLHQDSTFIYTQPETCMGLWFALEDATIQNGCLWAIPGEHKGPLRQLLVKNKSSSGIEILDTTPFNLNQAIPLEVPAGTLIVLHGRLPHYSEYNHSTTSRHAYSLHVVDAEAEYCQSNWLQESLGKPFYDWQDCLEEDMLI